MHLVSTRLARRSDLPGGKDFQGEDLRACIQDALQPFQTKEAAKKMASVGSLQRNECLNSVIGSKVPKIRHYGGPESSDHRTAAGVAQFNEGHNYDQGCWKNWCSLKRKHQNVREEDGKEKKT